MILNGEISVLQNHVNSCINEEGTERNEHRHRASSPCAVFTRVWSDGGVEQVSTLHISQLFYICIYTSVFFCISSFPRRCPFSAAVVMRLFLFFFFRNLVTTWSLQSHTPFGFTSVAKLLLEWWVVWGLWGNRERF